MKLVQVSPFTFINVAEVTRVQVEREQIEALKVYFTSGENITLTGSPKDLLLEWLARNAETGAAEG